jgi:nucleotide-binding universal stress UspA family protein
MKVEKILFPTDFSESANAALGRALFLAECLEAELHMLHAVVLHEFDPNNPEHDFPGAEEVFRKLFEIADSNMAGLLKQHGREMLTLREIKRRGVSAPEVILSYAEEMGADLIVMGTHGRRGPARLLLGSVAEAVTRNALCPVLTVRADARSVREESVKKILVPVDFSEASELTLRYAEQLGHLYHSGLELLHVTEENPYPYFYSPSESGALKERLERAGEALAKLAADNLSKSLSYTTSVRSGRVASEILDHVKEKDVDLLVIGTHGLSGLERVLVGSTAEQVIREAGCPVFVVKSKGKVVL